MTDVRQQNDNSKVLDKAPSPAAAGEDGALSKLLNEVYKDLGKLGLGPLSNVRETAMTAEAPPTDAPLLPPVDLFDTAKLPEAAPKPPVDAQNPIQLPIKLEMPALKFEGDGYSVSVSPTGNPLKQKGGIQVAGTF